MKLMHRGFMVKQARAEMEKRGLSAFQNRGENENILRYT